jgi:hypothetical protein
MNGNDFTTLYKTWATDKLLDIVDRPNEYQPLAVDAARLEIASRQLTQKQLIDARAEQDLRRRDKVNKQKQKVKDIEDKFTYVGSLLVDTVDPLQKKTPTADKPIKLISLFIGGLFLYQLCTGFGMLKILFSDNGGKWDLSVVLFFLPFIILPTAGLLFWFRKKNGWMLSTIYSSYTAVGAIPMFIMELNRQPTGIPALDTLFPTTSPTLYIGTLLVFGGLTWTLCKEDMREVYQVDRKAMFTALGIGTGVVFLMAILF